jgi:hypothetical protein
MKTWSEGSLVYPKSIFLLKFIWGTITGQRIMTDDSIECGSAKSLIIDWSSRAEETRDWPYLMFWVILY